MLFFLREVSLALLFCWIIRIARYDKKLHCWIQRTSYDVICSKTLWNVILTLLLSVQLKNMDNHCYLVGISLLIIALLISLFLKITTVELLVETHNVTFFSSPTNHSAVSLFAWHSNCVLKPVLDVLLSTEGLISSNFAKRYPSSWAKHDEQFKRTKTRRRRKTAAKEG